jgi:DNA polymerase III delta subunit
MLDAAFSGDRQRTLELYREQRQQRVEPHYIIAMLTWQLTALAQAVFADLSAGGRTEAALVAAGMSPFTARKSLALAKHISGADVRRMVNNLATLDSQIKTSVEPDAALELYLLRLGQM